MEESNQTEETKKSQKDDNWINDSLSSLRKYLLNIDFNKYQRKNFASDQTNLLTQLLKQNFLNDSRIFILGTASINENEKAYTCSLLQVCMFCSKFKNIVGKLLSISAEESEKSQESIESSVEDLPPKITTERNDPKQRGCTSFRTNASTERQNHLKPSIIALNKALRLPLLKCLDCHNVSNKLANFVINKTLEQLDANLDEKMADFNVMDIDLQKLQLVLDQNIEHALTEVSGATDNLDDFKARSQIEKLSLIISKMLFQAIAKMLSTQTNNNKDKRQVVEVLERVVMNNLRKEDSNCSHQIAHQLDEVYESAPKKFEPVKTQRVPRNLIIGTRENNSSSQFENEKKQQIIDKHNVEIEVNCLNNPMEVDKKDTIKFKNNRNEIDALGNKEDIMLGIKYIYESMGIVENTFIRIKDSMINKPHQGGLFSCCGTKVIINTRVI